MYKLCECVCLTACVFVNTCACAMLVCTFWVFSRECHYECFSY